MQSLLSFDKFITPSIIKIVFVIGLVLITLGGLFYTLYAIYQGAIVSALETLLFTALGLLGWRINCELILVFFDIREKTAIMAARDRL